METAKIDRDELVKVKQLYHEANGNTDSNTFNVPRDSNSNAWNELRSYIGTLSSKYGFNPSNQAINQNGEIVSFTNNQ